MRTNYCFLLTALLTLIVFSNCRKDQTDPSFAEVDAPTTAAGALIPGVADTRSENDALPCDHIPPQTNFASVIFRRLDGSIAPTQCFTEEDLLTSLLEGGKSSEEIEEMFSKLFYRAEDATPAKAFQLGQLIANFYDYAPESFNIDIMGRSDYPAPIQAPGGQKQGISPGFIDFYTVRQAHASPNEGLILQSGFSGMRFQNQCTGQMVTYEFPTTIDGFKRTFVSAGLSEKAAALLVKHITNGHYSIRQIWDLFQLQLAPKLLLVRTLLSQPNGGCWRLRQVGIGLYNAEQTTASFYFAQGDGALRRDLEIDY